MNEEKRLPMIRKIGYGIGDAGNNFCWTFIGSFFMLYCTNILGVSATVIGTLILFSKILDGITDLIMGRIIDATHSRLGKARFWYLVSIPPLAVFTFLLFNVPAGFTENTKYIYIFIVYTLIGAVFYTANSLAYGALSALCTKNAKDRLQMGSYRFIFAIVAVLIMTSATGGLVDMFGGGQKGWRAVSLIYSIACCVLLLIPFFSVKELPEEKKETEQQEKMNLKDMVFLVKNKYFMLLLLLLLTTYLTNGITGGMGVYFVTYQLGNPSLLGTLTFAGMLPTVILLPFIPQIASKIGMRESCVVGNLLGVAGGVLTLIGGLTVHLPLLFAGLVIKGFGGAPQTGSLNALTAEVDEYSYLKYGKRMTGTIFAAISVGVKVGTGVGTAICGLLLDLGGFDGMAAVQTATAVSTINWSYLLGGMIPSLICVVIFYLMKVEKENARMRAEKEKA